MSLHAIFLLIMAAFVFIGLPIFLLWAMVDFLGGKKGSDRRGGGGVSTFVGGAMMEMDRMIRPSVEYQVEAQDEERQSDEHDGQ